MLPRVLDRFTPRALPRTRLLTAALVWAMLGIFLLAKGAWISRQESTLMLLVTLVVGAVIGVLKSRFILDPVAGGIIVHIGGKPSRACLGGLFSVRNWALILAMIIFGRILGVLPLAAPVKSAVCIIVGSGLVFSSRLLWRTWGKAPDQRRVLPRN